MLPEGCVLVLLAVLAVRMNVMTIPYEVNLMQINDLYPLSSHHLKHRILLHFETELKPKPEAKDPPDRYRPQYLFNNSTNFIQLRNYKILNSLASLRYQRSSTYKC